MSDDFLSTDHKVSLDACVRIINQEIQWCYQNPLLVTPQYLSGFIKGLEQAKYLITQGAKHDR